MVDEEYELLDIENKLKEQKKRILDYIKRDLAYIWGEEVKTDFQSISSEMSKLAFIFRKMHSHYNKDRELYAEEMRNLRELVYLVNRVKAKESWVRKFNKEIQKMIANIERERQEDAAFFDKRISKAEGFKLLLPHRMYRWKKLFDWGNGTTSYYSKHLLFYLMSHWKETEAIAKAAHPHEKELFGYLSILEELIPVFGLMEVGMATAKIIKNCEERYLYIVFEYLRLRIWDKEIVIAILRKWGISNIGLNLAQICQLMERDHDPRGVSPLAYNGEIILKYGLKELAEIVKNLLRPHDRIWFFHQLILQDNSKRLILEFGFKDLLKLQQSVNPTFFNVIFNCLRCCERINRVNGVLIVGAKFNEVLREINKKYLESFASFIYACRNIINTLEDIDSLRVFFLQLVSLNNDNFMNAFLTGLSKTNLQSFSHLDDLYDLARAYWDLIGESIYTRKLLMDGLPKLRPLDAKINRLPFKKTGSVLIPLAGRLTGLLFRVINKKAFLAWKKAYDLGIPCEEILRFYPRQGDKVAVVTRYAGENLEIFIKKHPEWRDHLGLMRLSIIKRLKDNGIFHRDPQESNFVVEMINNKPFVRIIDFDLVISPSP